MKVAQLNICLKHFLKRWFIIVDSQLFLEYAIKKVEENQEGLSWMGHVSLKTTDTLSFGSKEIRQEVHGIAS